MLNEIIKVDLHIHSKASQYKEVSSIVANSDIDHLDVLFEKLQENHIGLFSITDHNVLDSKLYKAIQERISSDSYPDVKGVIPGIEFDVRFEENKEPCHVMAYFEAKSSDDYRKIECGTLNDSLGRETKYTQDEFEKILHRIGLPVILIAFQRKALDTLSGGKNSFSDAVDDVLKMLEVGYISGFDVQKPNVEGMVRRNLHSPTSRVQQQVGMLIASDCHQWSAYPAHDSSCEQPSVSFSSIKSLPTFKGLLMALTSPETRFSRIENTSQAIIKSFSYGEGNSKKIITLSPGINVIVGENGSGKSTLLDFLAGEGGSLYEKKIISKNHLAKDDSSDNIEYIRQAELINQYQNGDLTSYGIYKDAFPEIDTTDFSQELRQYIQAVQEKVSLHINASSQSQSTPTIIEFSEKKPTFNVTIHTGQLSVANSSRDSNRYEAIAAIIRKLRDESNNSYYTQSEKTDIQKVISILKKFTQCYFY